MTTDPNIETARALLRDAENYLSALHGSVARHDNLAANLGCAGCELRDQIGAVLATPAAGLGVSATPSHTDLRQRIAAAVERLHETGGLYALDAGEPERIADAVLSELPPPADRAAILREAADAVFALDYDDLVSEQDDENLGSMREAWDFGTIHASQLLRRLADEAPQPEPDDPTQCSGEEGFCPEHGFHRHTLKQPGTADRAAVLADDEGDELVCVDQCGSCDACGMEPFGTPAEGWRQAAHFLRRTARESSDRQGALHGARLIEAELRRLADEAQQQPTACPQCGDTGACNGGPCPLTSPAAPVPEPPVHGESVAQPAGYQPDGRDTWGGDCCGAEPTDKGWIGDCWCTLQPGHDGEHRCQPCTDRHGAPGWTDEPAVDARQDGARQ